MQIRPIMLVQINKHYKTHILSHNASEHVFVIVFCPVSNWGNPVRSRAIHCLFLKEERAIDPTTTNEFTWPSKGDRLIVQNSVILTITGVRY